MVGLGLNVDWPGPPGVGGTCLARPGRRGRWTGERSSTPCSRPSPPAGPCSTAPPGRREVAAELRDAAPPWDRRVRVELAAEAVVGVATEIDDAGHLVVRTAAGPRTVSAGDVVHLRPG